MLVSDQYPRPTEHHPITASVPFAMSNAPIERETTSQVRLKLLDPLGRAIAGLKYQIRIGSKIIAQGLTDADGRIQQFQSDIGEPLSVQVERFIDGGMKEIRQITPWTERFSVKLVSGKVKEKSSTAPDAGSPGDYQRKTYVVRKGDSLSKIATTNGTTAEEIARLNQIGLNSLLQIGQILKITSAPRIPPPPASPAPSASPAAAPQAAPASRPEEPSAVNGPAPAPVTTTVPPSAPVSTGPVPSTPAKDDRGENGTPKTTISLSCQGACLKLGDRGALVEELNIRLTGFGGTVSAPKPLNEFTTKTESAVKQFQRDYMGVAETGKVCGPFLKALDDFLTRYPINLAKMRCTCGHCNGFGNGYTDSREVKIFSDSQKTKPYKGTEYPGMHRAILWGLRAALFYTAVKDKDLAYSFLKVSSGYRCWHDNKAHNRRSTNHMGNALDLQFRKGEATTRCEGSDVDKLRSKIFVKRLGAQLSWPEDNKLSLETAAQGATSWVHVDVREYDTQYKDSRFYAVTQAVADGDPMLDIATREGRLPLTACGGLQVPAGPPAGLSPAAALVAPSLATPPVPPLPASTQPTAPSAGPLTSAATEQRTAVSSLSISDNGILFIQGWEKCGLQPYDDSEGYCTIGWGHLINKNKCANIQNDASFKPFKNGVSQSTADNMLKEDIKVAEDLIHDVVQVPMFQHEYDALVSLIFNLGGFKKCPKLLSKLNTKDYSGCCDEFADITNHGTEGLVKRRKAEMNIFRNKVYNSAH